MYSKKQYGRATFLLSSHKLLEMPILGKLNQRERAIATWRA